MREGVREFLTQLVVKPAVLGVFTVGALVVAMVSALSSPIAAAVIAAIVFLSVVVVLGYGLYTRDRFGGSYEVLDEEITWDLVRIDGSEVVQEKSLDVCFLQSNVLVWVDYAWGDGEIMAEYTCSPGRLVEKKRVADRTWLIILLERVRNRGDRATLETRRTVRGGFERANEWASFQIVEKTRHLKLSIVFPKDRPCQRAYRSSQAGQRQDKEIDVSDPQYNSDGRQVLVVDEKHPKVGQLVTISWDW